ncbi:MAG: galactosyltransferase-related protein [Phycisphaerales bacterium JB059]
MPEAHVVVITHTHERLRRTFLALACQSTPPHSITLSCDDDDPELERVSRAASDEFNLPIRLVTRPRMSQSRSAQVRNNAVRALHQHNPDHEARLIFLDGDCAPEPELVAKHVALGVGRVLVHAGRINLTPEQTQHFDEDALREGRPPATPTPEQLAEVAKRHARYKRHALLRRVGMMKVHKPKLVSANFSLRLRDFIKVNGFDESYEGWGQEDDDLGRRLYMVGVRPVIAVADILAFHQHHDTRAPTAWSASPNAARLEDPCPPRAVLGLDHPASQPEPRRLDLTPTPEAALA